MSQRRGFGTVLVTSLAILLALATLPAAGQTASAQGTASGGGEKAQSSPVTPAAAGTASSPTLVKRTQEPEAGVVVQSAEVPVPYNPMDGADEDMLLALAGWSSKYRIGLDVQDGDWVKYETVGDGPRETLELRIEKNPGGDLWLTETRTPAGSTKGTETHMHFSAGKPKLLEGYRILPDGTREELAPPDDMKAGELFLEARTDAMDALGGDRTKFKVVECEDVQEITGPFGTLKCRCIEVRVAEDISPISFATTRRWLSEGTLVWFNDDVPRLMPMSAVLLPAMLEPDTFMMVTGGLVRSPYHVLVDYRRRGE